MGDGEKDNAKRDGLHRIESDLTPQEWDAWVWHGIVRLEQRLAAEAELDRLDGERDV